MSPSKTSSDDFPRLNGASNFDIWKARIRAALDGKNLLGFIERKDYDGLSDSDDEPSDMDVEELEAVDDEEEAKTAEGGPSDDAGSDTDSLDPNADPDEQSGGNSGSSKSKPSGLPRIKPFAAVHAAAERRRLKSERAEARRARAPDARKLKRMEARTIAFLMKTMDNTHIRLVKDLHTAFDIYQMICSKYEGTNAHGDPYNIMEYLFSAKFKEGADLMEFVLQYEDAMRALSDALGATLEESFKSMFLFNAMPKSWTPAMQIWKGTRQLIPYEELKRHLEAKVRVMLAEERYTLSKGTPESESTQKEKALAVTAPPQEAVTAAIATGRTDGCSYCNRSNHHIKQCRNLQQDLRDGCVKEGTVLPANFQVRNGLTVDNKYGSYSRPQRKAPFYRPHKGDGEPYRRTFNGNRQEGDNRPNFRQADRDRNDRQPRDNRDRPQDMRKSNGYFQSRRDAAMVVITETLMQPQLVISLSATIPNAEDNVWTVDSGCTRHVTHQQDWFTAIMPTSGMITVGGKNQIPIQGIGQVALNVTDSKGGDKVMKLTHVLFAPSLQFNLLSVPAGVKDDFKFTFKRQHCVINTNQSFTIKATMPSNIDLYQFKAMKPTGNAHALNATHGGKLAQLILMHKRLGHLNLRTLQEIPRNEAILNFKMEGSERHRDYICPSCALAKSHRLPFPKRANSRAKFPLEKIHSDICGPMPTTSLTGCRYFLLFIDDFTRFMHLYTIKLRSDLYDCYEDFRKKALNIYRNDIYSVEYRASQHDEEIRMLQTDNAKEYEMLARTIFEKYGTHAQFTNAYSPEQNGVAERRNRTIMERVRALLFDGKLPRELWAECARHVCDLINMSPSSVLNGQTPYELWFDRKPSAENLKVFGCTAYAHIPEEHRDKLDTRARLCMYLGIPSHKKGFRLMDVATGNIVYSRDVTFDESAFPRLKFLHRTDDTAASTNVEPLLPATESVEQIDAPQQPKPWLRPLPMPAIPAETSPAMRQIVENALKRTYAQVANASSSHRRVKAIPPPAASFGSALDAAECEEHSELVLSLLAIRYVPEPQSFEDAMRSEHAANWLRAAQDEIQSHRDNQTWDLVPAPPRRKILKNRWVWVVKYTAQGEIDRFKARLVIKGFQQRYGIDYHEIFAPVIRMEVLRLLFAIAATLDYEIHQMDVKTAFLNGNLDEEIYMEQPEGFIEPGSEHLVCKLRKSLYGLKQAPRVWYQTLTRFMEESGFHRITKDHCVFVGTLDGRTCYVAIYVDDLLISAPLLSLVDHIKSLLKHRFQMTDLGEAHHLLGWSIERDRHARTLFIHQEKYATKVLDRFGNFVSFPAATPTDPNVHLSDNMCPQNADDELEMRCLPYREAVGSFMYLMVGTRPDLAYFVREVSQFLSKPGREHWNAVVRGLRYLHGTQAIGLVLGGRTSTPEHLLANSLTSYTDSDYAACTDTRRCVGGYITMLGKSPISWLSRKHHTVVLSTTEAEYIALCHGMQEMLFLKYLLGELGFATSTALTIHEDNQSCIKLANNPELHGRSKHIDIRYHFVQEKVERKEFVIEYCETKAMSADIFTKGLAKQQFRALRLSIGLMPKERFIEEMQTSAKMHYPQP